MSSAISRLTLLSQKQNLALIRLNLSCLSSYVPARSVQEFPATKLNNSICKDYFLVMPECLKDPDNEFIRISNIAINEVNFGKINAETAFKGLSQAICDFENFIVDRENESELFYKCPEEMFEDLEKHLYPLDLAHNLLMTMISIEPDKYSYKEIINLLERYKEVKDKRFAGIFGQAIKRFSFHPNLLADQSDKKLLDFYRYQANCPIHGRPVDESTMFEMKKNLKINLEAFVSCFREANSLLKHTVDDPDILAAVADEYEICQDLHHKERTPLIVTPATYSEFMKVCPDRFVRRMLWETYNKRCSPKALPRLNTSSLQTSIRTARRKIAGMLGFRSHLDFKLRNTMAQTKKNVLASLQSIDKENRPILNERLQELNDFASDNQFDDPTGIGIQDYDIDYWSHKYTYDILLGMSQRQLASYFPLENVLRGITNYFGDYFSIDISTKESSKLWSSQAQILEWKRNGKPIGHVIYDPFQHSTRQNLNVSCAHIKPRYADNTPTMLISCPYMVDPSTRAAHLNISEVLDLHHCFAIVLQNFLNNFKFYELNVSSALEYDTLDLLPYLCTAHLFKDHKILQSFSSRVSQSKTIDSELSHRITKALHYSRPLNLWRTLYKAHLDLELNSTMTSSHNLANEIFTIYSPFERFKHNYDYCAMVDIFVGPCDGVKYANIWAQQLASRCLEQLENSDGKLSRDVMKEFYSKLVVKLFDSDDHLTEPKLASLFGPGFEPLKSGLGVL